MQQRTEAREAAINEAIENADTYLSKACIPTYHELIDFLRVASASSTELGRQYVQGRAEQLLDLIENSR